jgi:HSP20 family protein
MLSMSALRAFPFFEARPLVLGPGFVPERQSGMETTNHHLLKEEVIPMTRAPMLPVLWSSWNRLQKEMDRLFAQPAGAPRGRPLAPSFPPVNGWEDEEAFHFEAELPGFKQEDLTIQVQRRNQLTIQGERKTDPSLQGVWHRRERGTGRFQRTFVLPLAVEADKVEARLENGVLHLTLPKAAEARPRRIVVKGE